MRAPESQLSRHTFFYCTSRESLGCKDAVLHGQRIQPVRAQLTASHRKHPIVTTGFILSDNGIAALRQLYYHL